MSATDKASRTLRVRVTRLSCSGQGVVIKVRVLWFAFDGLFTEMVEVMICIRDLSINILNGMEIFND